MTSVIVSVALQSAKFPAGTAEVSAIRITVAKAGEPGQVQDVAPSDPVTATFASVAPGAYTASAVSIGADGIEIGAPLTADFTVPEPDVDRAVPASVSVQLGA
jgi:hypothetical protein